MGLTIEGSPMNSVQEKQAEILLGVVNQLKAGSICAEAIICAAIGESTLTNLSTPNSLGFWGVLQGYSGLGDQAETAWFPPPSGWNDSAGMATAFLQGGKGFQSAMGQVRAGVTDPGQIAATCEGSGAGSYFYGQHLADAKAIIAAYGGSTLTGGVAGAGGSGTTVDGASSDTYTFQIGGTDNPDEDYWTGINRLAQEVNWYLFSNFEYLYYMDGQEMISQRPALYLDRLKNSDRIVTLRGNYDNTAYLYVSDHLRKFRAVRKTGLTVITSPTEVDMDLICGIDEVRGGDVIVLSSFGPLDGRWIVGTTQRSVLGVTSTITLVPPIAPLTEAASVGTTGKSPNSTVNLTDVYPVKLTGDLRNHVVQVALAAIQRQKTQGAYKYGEVRPVPGSLFGTAPITTDCSGFSLLCYKDGGAPDPLGNNYNSTTMENVFTGNLVTAGSPVTTPQPGDLLFYAGPAPKANGIGHVAVYVGNGNIANMGAPGEPVLESMTAPGPIVAQRSYL